MGAGTSAEEFFLKSINVESIFEFVERTDYLFLYSIKECVEKSDCHTGETAVVMLGEFYLQTSSV